jgi:hypothetical protein
VRAYIANASDGAGDACKIAEALQCSDGIVQDGGGVAALRYVGNRGRSTPARLALERTLVTHRDIARDFLREEEDGKVTVPTPMGGYARETRVAQGCAMSNGRTFAPPAIRGFDGSKCSRSSRFWTSARATTKASFRLLACRSATLKKASPK